MRQRWGDVLDHDPYWNPNLSPASIDLSLAFPPRKGRIRIAPPSQEEAGGRLDRVKFEQLAMSAQQGSS
jgi:hypothetical protein